MNESVLILADFVPKKLKNVQTIDRHQIDLEKLFKVSVKTENPKTYLYVNVNCEEVFTKIKSETRVIKAAGGLVKNGNGEILMIFRLGKWDLPKGKVENNEKMKEAAVREVEEECGIKINYLGKKIVTSYHTYCLRNGEFVMKITNWYDMGINKEPKLIPQYEEDITKAEWVDPLQLDEVLTNTYPIIASILHTLK